MELIYVIFVGKYFVLVVPSEELVELFIHTHFFENLVKKDRVRVGYQ